MLELHWILPAQWLWANKGTVSQKEELDELVKRQLRQSMEIDYQSLTQTAEAAWFLALAEAAFLLGARARDRQLLDEFRFHLPFDAAKIEGIMRVTKPEELLSEPRSVRV